MNEKIKLLCREKADYWLNHYDRRSKADMELLGKDIEKFADLIVEECIGITDDLVNRNVDGSWTSNELYTDYNGALFEVKRRIQECFGVE